MIVVLDYDTGNLKSVVKAFEFLDIDVKLTDNKSEIEAAEGVVLPGVGAFGEGMNNLRKKGLVEVIRKVTDRGIPFLGICLGMQLLFNRSAEAPGVSGLELVEGEVEKFTLEDVVKIPHMGWNQVQLQQEDILFSGVKDGSNFYFVHSYYVTTPNSEIIVGETEYGKQKFVSVIHQDNVWGFQCHPEKSSEIGLKVLENFSEVVINGSNTSS
ncbi:MAG: imidazole glycerol phosphate synthase subunit HisH [Halanaerobiaceae bacterium]